MVLQPVYSACCEYGAAKGQDVLIEHDAGVVHGLAVEFILLAGPGTQQHRGVQIVAAAVHGAGVALERQTGLLLKGQSIHIGPEQNGLAGAAALDGGGQRAVGQLLRAIAILDQFFHYKGFGPGQLLPHFCILMKGVPHLHQLGLESKGLLIDLVHKIKLLSEKPQHFTVLTLGDDVSIIRLLAQQGGEIFIGLIVCGKRHRTGYTGRSVCSHAWRSSCSAWLSRRDT